MTYTLEWTDSRLQFPELDNPTLEYVTLRKAQDFIWIPDIYFLEETDPSFHSLVKPQVFTRVYANGQVVYSSTINPKLTCPSLDTDYYQGSVVCSITLASYAYEKADLLVKWNDTLFEDLVQDVPYPFQRIHGLPVEACENKVRIQNSCVNARFNLTHNYDDEE